MSDAEEQTSGNAMHDQEDLLADSITVSDYVREADGLFRGVPSWIRSWNFFTHF